MFIAILAAPGAVSLELYREHTVLSRKKTFYQKGQKKRMARGLLKAVLRFGIRGTVLTEAG
jgi:hypothetical protein